jgi:hypothetical protein
MIILLLAGNVNTNKQEQKKRFYHEPHEQKIRATYRDGTDEKEEILKFFLPSIFFILSVLAFMLTLSRSCKYRRY